MILFYVFRGPLCFLEKKKKKFPEIGSKREADNPFGGYYSNLSSG